MGRYDEKYSWLKSMGGFFDDILRFADYIPVVLSHTSHLFLHLYHNIRLIFLFIHPPRREKKEKKAIMAQYTHQKHSWFSLLASWR